MAPRSVFGNTVSSPVLRARPISTRPRGAITTTSRSSGSSRVAEILAAGERNRSAGPVLPPARVPTQQHKPKSILGQFGDIGKGLIPGVGGFLKDALTDAVAVPRAAADVIGGHGLRNVGAYVPAATGLLKSFGRTGSDIIHPSHFAQAVREGSIVGKVLEDVGNLAVVAGPAAKAIGSGGALAGEASSAAARAGLVAALPEYRGLAGVAARAGDIGTAQTLQRVGNVVQKVGTLGEMPGNAIAKPFELGGKGLTRAGTAVGLDRAVSPIVERAGQTVGDWMDRPGPNIPGLARANRAYKTWVLPFSTKWHIGNQIGNPMQAFFHGGVGPVELTKFAGKILRDEGNGSVLRGVRALWRESGSPAWASEVSQGGLSQAAAVEGVGTTGVGRFVRKAAAGSYKLNRTVDNLARDSLYLAKKAAGETDTQALRSVSRSFGDYASLKPFEQNFMREALPFYPWMKHSIGATLRMPFVKPSRAAFLGGLANRYYDPEHPPSPLTGQRIPFGGKLLNIGTGIPFADISPTGFALDPTNLSYSVAPAIKTAASIGLGLDLSRDLKGLTRPASTSRLDEFGRPTTTPPLTRLLTDPRHALGEIGWQLTQQGPGAIREGRNLLLGNAKRYAGTGYQYGSAPDPNRSRLLSLLRMLNLPTVEPMPS